MARAARSLSMIVNSLLAHLKQSVDLEAREQMLPRQMGKSRERMSNGSFTSLSCSGAEISEGGDSGTALCFVLQAYTSNTQPARRELLLAGRQLSCSTADSYKLYYNSARFGALRARLLTGSTAAGHPSARDALS